ncbi:hypothetical protein PQG22_03750 [Aquirufa beregesia]
MKRVSANSNYKKLAAQRLNEALNFVSSVLIANSLVHRNSHCHQGTKHWQ